MTSIIIIVMNMQGNSNVQSMIVVEDGVKNK